MTTDSNHPKNQSGKKDLSRRDFLKISAATAAGLAVGAATPALAAPAPSTARRYAQGSPTTVRLWTWYKEQDAQMPKIIANFEAANPNIKIDYELKTDVTGAYLPALLAAAASGNVADMPEIYAPHVHSVEFGRKGIAVDLAKALGATFLSDFFASANSMFSDGAAQYAVGWMAQTFGIFYDPDMFSKAGINGEPETWDDLITVSTQIKSKLSGNLGVMQIGSDGFSVSDTWMPMITGASNDPTTLSQLDAHTIPWTSKPVIDALTLYKKTLDGNLWQKGQTGMTGDDCLNAFYAGKGAAFYSGSWNPVSMYKAGPPDLIKRMKIMKTPAVTAGGRHWTGNSAGAAYSVANGPNKDAALTFFKYIYSADVYGQLMIDSASMPATQSAATKISDPFIKLMTSWLADGCRHWLVGPAGQAVADAIEAFTQNPTDPQATAQAMEAGALKVQPMATQAATKAS
jgi:ABC-type glycerol-3-phosphate transport system substrate-binding protein